MSDDDRLFDPLDDGLEPPEGTLDDLEDDQEDLEGSGDELPDGFSIEGAGYGSDTY